VVVVVVVVVVVAVSVLAARCAPLESMAHSLYSTT
jgi:hypothetical protein